MNDNAITKTEADSPDRCQAMTSNGQCLNKIGMVGGTVCVVHGANAQVQSADAKSLKNYRLTKFRAQAERLAGSEGAKTLTDEIGILRVMMEERLNQCEGASDLMMQSQTIGDLAMKIEKLVVSCTKLEQVSGSSMDKSALLNFASRIIAIISDNVTDPETVDIIGQSIIALIGENNAEA